MKVIYFNYCSLLQALEYFMSSICFENKIITNALDGIESQKTFSSVMVKLLDKYATSINEY